MISISGREIIAVAALLLAYLVPHDIFARLIIRIFWLYIVALVLDRVVSLLRKRLSPVPPGTLTYALVTGASSGIGHAMALEFAKKGYNLILVARNEEALNLLAEQIHRAANVECKVIAHDLSEPGAAQGLLDKLHAVDSGLHVEILVNNAGIGGHGDFIKWDAKLVHTVMEVNMVALTELTRLLLPPMITRGRGRVVLVSSTASFWHNPTAAVYGATKAYVSSFGRALEVELRGTGVGVTIIHPGPTISSFAQTAGLTNSMIFQLPGGVQTSQQVAEEAVTAVLQGKRDVITGTFNVLTTWAVWICPPRIGELVIKFMWGSGNFS